MRSKCRESESSYNSGCRCEACRLAASEGRRERRRLARESVGEFPTDRTSLVSIPINNASTSVDADMSVVAAVLEEISAWEGSRPGVAAAAKAMAAILDNPKAVSTKPQAAKVLISLLDKLQKASTTRRGKLAVVRTMTRKGDA